MGIWNVHRWLGFVLVFVVLLFSGCTGTMSSRLEITRLAGAYSKTTLISDGCGYEIGDVVILNTEKEPGLGDVVYYDWRVNESDCMGFGAGRYMARIVGLPGDNATFHNWSYEANGYKIELGSEEKKQKRPDMGNVMWGSQRYDTVTGLVLAVPDGEFLADNWIGPECIGEEDESGNLEITGTYNRYTVRKEAILGIITMKIWHDNKFEEQRRGAVY